MKVSGQCDGGGGGGGGGGQYMDIWVIFLKTRPKRVPLSDEIKMNT